MYLCNDCEVIFTGESARSITLLVCIYGTLNTFLRHCLAFVYIRCKIHRGMQLAVLATMDINTRVNTASGYEKSQSANARCQVCFPLCSVEI